MEAGILLYNSLKGELEEELEDAAVDRIYDPDGVTFIVDTIQKAVETRTVHLKRQLLSSYIYRSPTESMRSFTNRYQRTERSLATINIRVQDMYDSEARGARLLERAKLSPEHQRQILISAGQSLEFDQVKDVLLFQWPDHKGLPPALGAPADRGGKGLRSHTGFQPKGKGKPSGKQVFAAETVERLPEHGLPP